MIEAEKADEAETATASPVVAAAVCSSDEADIATVSSAVVAAVAASAV